MSVAADVEVHIWYIKDFIYVDGSWNAVSCVFICVHK